MNTAMSTKRTHISNAGPTPRTTDKGGSHAPLIAFVGGFLVMLLGIATSIGWIAVIGFTAFVCAFMYLNSMFWADFYKDKDMQKLMKDRSNYWI